MAKPALISMAAQLAERTWPYLLARKWQIYQSMMPLITCDEPVVPVSIRTDASGRTNGIGTASALMFPLGPHHLLDMFHPEIPLDRLALYPELLPIETDEVNQFIASKPRDF
jgi:hypothetical protein